MSKLEGGCQCGNVRFEVTGEPHFSCVCHCPSCRKATGAPLIGWAMFDLDSLNCERNKVRVFESSKGVRRSFCPMCGTTLFYEADIIPGLVDITTESFDSPDQILPAAQIWVKHETACVRSLANMARFETLPVQE